MDQRLGSFLYNIFGPQVPARTLEVYEYHSLVQEGMVSCQDFFMMVWIQTLRISQNLELHMIPFIGLKPRSLPTDIHSEPPSVPARRVSTSTPWYMTKASLKGLIKILYVESLGQIRWELDMIQVVRRPKYIESDTIDGRDYIKNVLSNDIEDYEGNLMTNVLLTLRQWGALFWWFSHIGDMIELHGE
ncbi:conserved hypothetical protein [Talaromyces stipitatus ATCC 10500]|uniref:Uncharacterized protein n=1 Tax=Talaromyces stipitatus (strain ATCC 10500 / CBS 375.48 / QM 6759 / NRRL 1006) TaxID=441959 RepID=B8MNL2_TALSN|nr:uncharacterized protein TSTA_103250 [Talaromyces stipitatus ATCC 10500]EED14101.1 conserved hypothetical protein [Talaromyces stipitatus ATCC 10500]